MRFKCGAMCEIEGHEVWEKEGERVIIKTRQKHEGRVRWELKVLLLPNITFQPTFLCLFLRGTNSWRPGDTAGETPLNSTEACGKQPNGDKGGSRKEINKKHFTYWKRAQCSMLPHTHSTMSKDLGVKFQGPVQICDRDWVKQLWCLTKGFIRSHG